MFKIVISFFLFILLWVSSLPKYNFIPEKIYFYHYDFIEINLPQKLKNLKNLYFSIEKKKKKIKGIDDSYFFTPVNGKIKIPCPWNLKQGLYTIRPFHPLKKLRKFLPSTGIIIIERKQKEIKNKFFALTWENNKPLRSLKIPPVPGESNKYNYNINALPIISKEAKNIT